MTETEECVNCGTLYTLKKGMPELCWVCGMPTDEKIEGLMPQKSSCD